MNESELEAAASTANTEYETAEKAVGDALREVNEKADVMTAKLALREAARESLNQFRKEHT